MNEDRFADGDGRNPDSAMIRPQCQEVRMFRCQLGGPAPQRKQC